MQNVRYRVNEVQRPSNRVDRGKHPQQERCNHSFPKQSVSAVGIGGNILAIEDTTAD